MDHLVKHIKNPLMKSDNNLHVIGVVSNPARWQSRIRLFKKWRDEMLMTPGVVLHVVEGLYGDHQPECAPEAEQYSYMNVKLSSELWLKESMLNVGIRNLFPNNWKYMSWCDTDLHFRNKDWANGSIRALQTYNVIQPWSHGTAILFDGSARTPIDASFGFLHATGQKMSWGRHQEGDGYKFSHPGYVWCCNRYFWENIEKLIDFCIIGSADHHQAHSMIGNWEQTIDRRLSEGYKEMLKDWSKKAQRACGGMIGYVPGVVEHGHHGPLKGRAYGERWKILLGIDFDPKRDLAYDSNGIVTYIGKYKNELNKGLISYNRTRNEDSSES